MNYKLLFLFENINHNVGKLNELKGNLDDESYREASEEFGSGIERLISSTFIHSERDSPTDIIKSNSSIKLLDLHFILSNIEGYETYPNLLVYHILESANPQELIDLYEDVFRWPDDIRTNLLRNLNEVYNYPTFAIPPDVSEDLLISKILDFSVRSFSNRTLGLQSHTHNEFSDDEFQYVGRAIDVVRQLNRINPKIFDSFPGAIQEMMRLELFTKVNQLLVVTGGKDLEFYRKEASVFFNEFIERFGEAGNHYLAELSLAQLGSNCAEGSQLMAKLVDEYIDSHPAYKNNNVSSLLKIIDCGYMEQFLHELKKRAYHAISREDYVTQASLLSILSPIITGEEYGYDFLLDNMESFLNAGVDPLLYEVFDVASYHNFIANSDYFYKFQYEAYCSGLSSHFDTLCVDDKKKVTCFVREFEGLLESKFKSFKKSFNKNREGDLINLAQINIVLDFNLTLSNADAYSFATQDWHKGKLVGKVKSCLSLLNKAPSCDYQTFVKEDGSLHTQVEGIVLLMKTMNHILSALENSNADDNTKSLRELRKLLKTLCDQQGLIMRAFSGEAEHLTYEVSSSFRELLDKIMKFDNDRLQKSYLKQFRDIALTCMHEEFQFIFSATLRMGSNYTSDSNRFVIKQMTPWLEGALAYRPLNEWEDRPVRVVSSEGRTERRKIPAIEFINMHLQDLKENADLRGDVLRLESIYNDHIGTLLASSNSNDKVVDREFDQLDGYESL